MLFYITAFCFFYNNSLLAQRKASQPTKHSEKYFISGSYGQGRAHWVSEISNADLYNPDGTLIKNTGDLNFKIQNRSELYHFNVYAPYGPVRLGLGLGFESFFLDKLVINTNGVKSYLPFMENFRFDKIGFLTEYPLPVFKESKVSLNANTAFGYYGFSRVKSFNFFGGPYLGNTFFINLGTLLDFEIIPHYYIFLQVQGEFKRFRNNSNENPTTIIHKIYSANVQAGLRINLYDYDFFKKLFIKE